MIVYRITNKINGKIYIGKSEMFTAEQRFKQHVKTALNQTKHQAISQAIRKYGSTSFRIEEIDSTHSADELNALEQKHILESGSYLSHIGYNRTMGGKNGRLTEETRRKISITVKNSMTRELSEKISAATMKAQTPEVRKKISIAITNLQKGRKRGNLSPEWRKALSEAHMGVPWSAKRRELFERKRNGRAT